MRWPFNTFMMEQMGATEQQTKKSREVRMFGGGQRGGLARKSIGFLLQLQRQRRVLTASSLSQFSHHSRHSVAGFTSRRSRYLHGALPSFGPNRAPFDTFAT